MRFRGKLCYNLFLISFLLASCDYVRGVGRNINLKKIPEAHNVSDLNVYRYVYENMGEDGMTKYGLKKIHYDPFVPGERKFQKEEQLKAQKTALLPKSGCVLDIKDGVKRAFDEKGTFGRVYAWTSAMTFSIIPYYLPGERSIRGSVIDAKTGNVLKEYFFEEKTIEWMALLPIFWFIPGYDNVSKKTPDAGTKVKEALIRTVTNDVYNFPECRKK